MRQRRPLPLIVIAEHDDEARDVLRGIFSLLPAEIVPARDGCELTMLLMAGFPPDLLVANDRMPWLTGFQVATSARRSGLRMPIILLTAFADEPLRSGVDALGAATLVAMPFRSEDLLALATSFLFAAPANSQVA